MRLWSLEEWHTNFWFIAPLPSFFGELWPCLPNTITFTNRTAASTQKGQGLRRSNGIGTRGRSTEEGLRDCGARYRSRWSALSSSISLTVLIRLRRTEDGERVSPVSQSRRHRYRTTIPIVSFVYFLGTVGTECNMFLHG